MSQKDQKISRRSEKKSKQTVKSKKDAISNSEETNNSSSKTSDDHSSSPNSSGNSAKKAKSKKKTNRGCWILAGIGCGLIILFIGVVVGLVILVGAVGSSASSDIGMQENIVQEGGEDKIAVIEIEGIITHGEDDSIFSAVGATPSGIASQIDRALEDDKVKAIILKVNSPGGEVVASDLMYRKVKEANEEKTVVTWFSSLGASGAYLVAAPSEKIITHPNSIVGSIGTLLQVSNNEELYDKLGIKTKTFKSGEFKDDEALFDPEDESQKEEALQIYQSLVDSSYEDFVEAVAQGRDMEIDEVKELADGRVFSGYQAYNNGLADEIGDMDKAVEITEDLVGKDDMQLIKYESPTTFFSSFSSYKFDLLESLGIEKEQEYSIGLYYLLEM